MKNNTSRLLSVSAGLLVFALSLSGCMSSQTETGPSLSSSRVDQIQKGVTTRAEVEAWFGQPLQVAMLSGGKRMLFYSHSNSSSDDNNVSKVSMLGMLAGAVIPGAGAIGMAGSAGGFVGGRNESIRSQSLSIRINADNIVEDYEFSDNTMNTQTGPGGARQSFSSNGGTPPPPFAQ
jgi:hypothetical protein